MARTEVSRRGLMLVLSSPSGGGKSTISRALRAEDATLVLSVSATTRAPRHGEVEGVHYYFVAPDTFDGMTARGELLEHAHVFGKSYGTPRAPVEAHLGAGRDVLFDIDWQGTRQLRENARDDLVSVFILPPSLAVLRQRLVDRGDAADAIDYRMSRAMDEIGHWDEYDYILVNDALDATIDRVRGILAAERAKRTRQTGLADYVAGLAVEMSS